MALYCFGEPTATSYYRYTLRWSIGGERTDAANGLPQSAGRSQYFWYLKRCRTGGGSGYPAFRRIVWNSFVRFEWLHCYHSGRFHRCHDGDDHYLFLFHYRKERRVAAHHRHHDWLPFLFSHLTATVLRHR